MVLELLYRFLELLILLLQPFIFSLKHANSELVFLGDSLDGVNFLLETVDNLFVLLLHLSFVLLLLQFVNIIS